MTLPRKHLVPRMMSDDPGGHRTLLYQLRRSPLLDVLKRTMARMQAAHDARPSAASAKRLNALLRLRGAWQASSRTRHDRALMFIPARLGEAAAYAEPMCAFSGFPFCYDVVTKSAIHKDLRKKRVLLLGSCGLGDLVVFSQLAASLRMRLGTVVDVAHDGTLADDELMARLFHPARVERLPIPYRVLRDYDYVLPLGMQQVFYGDTISDYLLRAYGTPYEAHGFVADADAEERMLVRLEHRHGIDPRKTPTIFVQPTSKPLKTYVHSEALVQALVARGHRVVLIGGRNDSALPDDIGKLANLCGVSVWSSIQAVKHARLVITPDSLFMHVAGALALPALALFGPTAAFWSSAYANTTAVCFSAACRWQPCWVPDDVRPPCGETRHPPCLSEMPVASLVALVEQKLAGQPMGPLVEVAAMPRRQVTGDVSAAPR